MFQPIVDALAELSLHDPALTPEELAFVAWSTFHGAVSLEVNHRSDWLEDPAGVHERAGNRERAGT